MELDGQADIRQPVLEALLEDAHGSFGAGLMIGFGLEDDGRLLREFFP